MPHDVNVKRILYELRSLACIYASETGSPLYASIAAAIAMTFAVSVSIIADRYLPGQSLPWILAIVVSYIFKDRIKESLREVLIHTAPGLVADERIRLTDQATGNKAGRVNSRVRFIKARNAPRDVLRARQTITSPLQHIHPEEDLIHYRRKIVINNKRLRKFHIRLDTVTDIVRLKLDELLRSMDAPEKMVSVFAENEKPRAMKSKRVYSLSLVICLTGFGNQNHSTQRFRLVMSRDGLKRIESD